MTNINEGEIHYKIIGESSDGKVRQYYWSIAVGLNEVDNLHPSQYFKTLIENNIKGKYSYKEVGTLIQRHYQILQDKEEYVDDGEKECDLVATRIYAMMADPSFSFHLEMLKHIHNDLFQDVINNAGKFRNVNIGKDEPTLNGATVKYGDYRMIEQSLKDLFDKESMKDYSSMTPTDMVSSISRFMSEIWKVHPFIEGNTRACSVFIGKYLGDMGFEISNKPFEMYSKYLRCALVRSNYKVVNFGFNGDNDCLNKFFDNLMFHREHILDLKDTIVKDMFRLPNGTYDIPYLDIFPELDDELID